MWKLKLVISSISIQWILLSNLISCLNNGQFMHSNEVVHSGKCEIVNSRSITGHDNLLNLKNLIIQNVQLDYSNRKLNKKPNDSPSLVDSNLLFDSFSIPNIASYQNIHKLESQHSASEHQNDSSFDNNAKHNSHKQIHFKYSHLRNLFSSFQNDANSLSNLPTDQYSDQSFLQLEENSNKDTDRIQLNLIDYPLVTSGLCFLKKQKTINNRIYMNLLESMDHHLNVINQCVRNLIETSFCETISFDFNCYWSVRSSVKELKKSKYLSCLNDGQLDSFDFIQQLFELSNREDQDLSEYNLLSVYLIETKSNFTRFILPVNLIDHTNNNLNRVS